MTRAATRMNPEDILLNKIHQSQKDKYGVIPLIRGTKGSQTHRDRKQNGQSVFNEHRVPVFQNKKVLNIDIINICYLQWT